VYLGLSALGERVVVPLVRVAGTLLDIGALGGMYVDSNNTVDGFVARIEQPQCEVNRCVGGDNGRWGEHKLVFANLLYLGGDDGYTERFIMNQLVRSAYTDDPIFLEQKVLATLWTKNIRQFWYHFSDYVRLHPNGSMPRYFQEAAYLYGRLEERTDLDRMPFDKGIKDTFERFMNAAAKYDNQDVQIGREGLYPFYGETYYYDYYMMKNLPEY
jgi:hypothetical protein